jgi:hypothetical protein
MGILLVCNWPYFTYSPALYDFLYGNFGVITALEQSPEGLAKFQDTLSTSPILYGVAILLLALVAGKIAFSFVHSLGATKEYYASTTEEKHDTLHRILIRGLVATTWIVYIVISVIIIFPFCILLSRIGAESITTSQGIIMNIEAFLLLAVSLHIHVIFLRLLCMRPRVFGGTAAIQDTAFYHK